MSPQISIETVCKTGLRDGGREKRCLMNTKAQREREGNNVKVKRDGEKGRKTDEQFAVV